MNLLIELIVTALATFSVLIFVLGSLPFRVPPKHAPILTTALAYGILSLYHVLPTLVQAAAVASVVALASRFIVKELPEPWSWDDFVGRVLAAWATLTKPRPKTKARVRSASKSAARYASTARDTAGSTLSAIGNRIPKL